MREVVRRGGAWPPTSVSANLVLEARAVNKVNSFLYIIKGADCQFSLKLYLAKGRANGWFLVALLHQPLRDSAHLAR